MKRAFILLFLLMALSVRGFAEESGADATPAPAAAATIQTGSIKVQFSKLRNTTGQLVVSLYTSREGFPMKLDKAAQKKIVQAADPKCEVVFEGIAYGTYAVSVFHDQNSNGKLDTVFLIGIPKEGVGCSNNAKGHFGPPSFADSKFILDQSEVDLNIELHYL